MNNAAAAVPQALPSIKTMVRAEHISQMKHFPEEQREKYITGVTELWKQIDSHSPDSEEYRNAHVKLFQVSKSIKQVMQKLNTGDSAQQQNGVRPASSGQPAQQDAKPAGLNPQNGVQPQPTTQFSQKVIEEVKKLGIVAPTHLNGNETAAKQWVRDAQRKYAENLSKIESDQKKLIQLHTVATTRATQGKPLDQRETENYHAQVSRLEQSQREPKQNLHVFQKQQESYKAQQAQGQSIAGGNATSTVGQMSNSSAQLHSAITGGLGPSQVKQELQGQPHTVSSAVDAARNQSNPAARSAMSPHNGGQPTQPPANTSRPPPNQAQASHSHPPLNIGTNSASQNQQSPRVALSQTSNMAHEPVALSHSAAMDAARDAARSYSQPNIAQQPPQSATHGPSSDQRNQNNHAKMPIPKDLNLAPTQPVSVGPSRPTLTNGPMAMGPMGQPAIQRHPGYVLEGEGERVLSKKKLEELVRQVTGGTGGEGEEGEGLDAGVEEVCPPALSSTEQNSSIPLTRPSSKSPTNSSTK